MNKTQLISLAEIAAQKFKKTFINKKYLYIYNTNDFFEMIGLRRNFKHLTGLGSNIGADDFFKKLVNPTKYRQIVPREINFTSQHPKDLAEKKLLKLNDLDKILSDSLIYKDFSTNTEIFKIAISDLTITLCLEQRKDSNMNPIENSYYFKSFRVDDEFDDAKAHFFTEYIFMSENNEKLFSKLVYGDISKIDELNDSVKCKLDIKKIKESSN